MITRRQLLISLGAIVLGPGRVHARSQGKIFRIGFLNALSRTESSSLRRMVLEGLREFGYVAGKNLLVEERFADGRPRRLQEHAAELVRQKVDVIIVSSTPAGQAAQQATRTIPIVITATADPVADGFARSLARPGGNTTGMSTGAAATVTKHFEFLTVAVPKLARLAVLVNPGNRAHPPQLKSLESAAGQSGIEVLAFEAARPQDLEKAIGSMSLARAGALVLLRESFFNRRGRDIAALAIKHKLPSISAFEGFVADGGLMSYGDDTVERTRRAAKHVDKILKGANPGDLPFEQPTKFHFAINRRTAHALGLTLPHELLLRADKVIE
jgi:putative ABC transport system substrate-binding protein